MKGAEVMILSEYPPRQVDNVLWEPPGAPEHNGAVSGVLRTQRKLYWPKDDSSDLAGALLLVAGRRCYVMGHPEPYLEQNCPTAWNTVVTAVDIPERSSCARLQHCDDQGDWRDVCHLDVCVDRLDVSESDTGGASHTTVFLSFETDAAYDLAPLRYEHQAYRLVFEGRAFNIVSFDDFISPYIVRMKGAYYGEQVEEV